MRNCMLKALVAVAALGLTVTARAATDGALGTTSTGTSVVTLTTGDAYQITQVSDINIGPVVLPAAAAATGTDFNCVYTNNATGNYHVTLSSANGAGAGFRLTNGVDTINYQAGWTGVTGSNFAANSCTAVPGTGCTDGVISPAVQTGANNIINCGGFTNATLSVSVPAANINAVPAGAYVDTITILVSP
jgi:hypothetical protein